MALRDQPYLPLYIQDILTDEKLVECSAAAHGIYLRLMCILHKQEKYGLLCLKQKHKQNESKIVNFASLLAKQMPFDAKQIQDGLQELIDEDVVQLDGDSLFQKRMVKDGALSLVRSEIGKTGGSSVTKQYGKSGFLYLMSDGFDRNKIGISTNPKNRLYRLRSDLKLPKHFNIIETVVVSDMGYSEDAAHSFFNGSMDGEWVKLGFEACKNKFALLKAKLLANSQPNTEYEYIDIIDSETEITEQVKKDYKMVVVEMYKVWQKANPLYPKDTEKDYHALLQFAYKIAEVKGWKRYDVISKREFDVLNSWGKICNFIMSDNWLRTKPLSTCLNQWQRIYQEMLAANGQTTLEAKRIKPEEYFTES